MAGKFTAPKIRALKGRQKIAVLTAYDTSMAKVMDDAGIPMILVGDSLGMTVLGYESTLPVRLEEMLHHARAVVRGVTSAMVIGDMPFMTYHASTADAVRNAGRFLQEAGVDGVKIEGGASRADTIRTLIENGIPVLGHIGLLPQSVRATGGYRIRGKTEEDVERLLADAKAVEEAGVFAMVLEGMPSDVAAKITAGVSIPTIGIGAGPSCDGQVLVVNDMLGFTEKPPRFVKRYADMGEQMKKAFAQYRAEVEGGEYPAREHEY